MFVLELPLMRHVGPEDGDSQGSQIQRKDIHKPQLTFQLFVELEGLSHTHTLSFQ